VSDELLERFKPQLHYDSQEAYFADSAAEMTDNPGNHLRRANGDTIASVGSGLTLDFLGSPNYANGQEALDTDRLGIHGTDYGAQYARLRESRPELRNRMYGHAKEDSRGRLWLQYWFWYFFNDYHLAADFGLHEGDWEMVQIRLHDGEPDLAVYAQHRFAERRLWSDVMTAPGSPDTPLVYPGRGSHAAYFEPGVYETEVWFDIADGKRETPELALEIVGDDSPPWVAWPGLWGDTQPTNPAETRSPNAPSQHAQWMDPSLLLKTAVTRPRKHPPPPPDVTVTRESGTLHVAYDFTHREGPEPSKLIVTVNSSDQHGVPPQTYSYDVPGKSTGQIDTGLPLEADKHYDVYTSVTSLAADGTGVPSASHLTEFAPAGELRVMQQNVFGSLKRGLFDVIEFFKGLGRRRRAKRGEP
jgi:hypothetical protein